MSAGFYRFARFLLRFFFAVICPLRVCGAERFPAEGAVILCGNHLSYLDPLSMAVCVPRTVRFIAKQELFRHKALKPLITWLGAFPVSRGSGDLAALRTALGILKEGGVLGIFPQGTRDPERRHAMEGGVALMALRSGAPVVPVRIFGPFRPFRRTDIVFGAPMDLSAYGKKCDSATIQQVTAAIESAIWSMERPQ